MPAGLTPQWRTASCRHMPRPQTGRRGSAWQGRQGAHSSKPSNRRMPMCCRNGRHNRRAACGRRRQHVSGQRRPRLPRRPTTLASWIGSGARRRRHATAWQRCSRRIGSSSPWAVARCVPASCLLPRSRWSAGRTRTTSLRSTRSGAWRRRVSALLRSAQRLRRLVQRRGRRGSSRGSSRRRVAQQGSETGRCRRRVTWVQPPGGATSRSHCPSLWP